MSVMATERELERAFLAKMVNELQAMRNTLEEDNFLIDEWGVGFNDTVIPVKRVYDGPIVVTSILAVYPPSSTSAVINLGQPGRTMNLPIAGFAPGFNQQNGNATFAAAGNGTATTPAGGNLSGFTITWGAVATANNVTVTVTGAQGGTITYTVPLTVTATTPNNPFQITFPGELLPAAAGGTISVTVTGNVNSPSGVIYIFGQGFSGTPAPNAGIFNPTDLRILLGIDDTIRNLTIAPAGTAYINFIGYADRKQIDRQIR